MVLTCHHLWPHLPPTPFGGCQNPLHLFSEHKNVTVTTGIVAADKNGQLMHAIHKHSVDTSHCIKFFTHAVLWVGPFLFAQDFQKPNRLWTGLTKNLIPLHQKWYQIGHFVSTEESRCNILRFLVISSGQMSCCCTRRRFKLFCMFGLT